MTGVPVEPLADRDELLLSQARQDETRRQRAPHVLPLHHPRPRIMRRHDAACSGREETRRRWPRTYRSRVLPPGLIDGEILARALRPALRSICEGKVRSILRDKEGQYL